MIHRFTTAIVVAAIGSALLCSSALAASVPDPYEPNEAPATAAGPLVGGQSYEAGIGSAADRDYFYFNTAGPGTITVAIKDYGYPWYGCRKDWTAITAAGDLLDYETSWGSDSIYGDYTGSSAVLSFAVTSATKVYVRVVGEPSPYCWGGEPYYYQPLPDKYTLSALPASSIAPNLPNPPAPPSEKCVKAKTAAGKDAARIKKLKKSIASARGRKAKRLRAKLRSAKKDLKSVNKRVAKYC